MVLFEGEVVVVVVVVVLVDVGAYVSHVCNVYNFFLPYWNQRLPDNSISVSSWLLLISYFMLPCFVGACRCRNLGMVCNWQLGCYQCLPTSNPCIYTIYYTARPLPMFEDVMEYFFMSRLTIRSGNVCRFLVSLFRKLHGSFTGKLIDVSSS